MGVHCTFNYVRRTWFRSVFTRSLPGRLPLLSFFFFSLCFCVCVLSVCVFYLDRYRRRIFRCGRFVGRRGLTSFSPGLFMVRLTESLRPYRGNQSRTLPSFLSLSLSLSLCVCVCLPSGRGRRCGILPSFTEFYRRRGSSVLA